MRRFASVAACLLLFCLPRSTARSQSGKAQPKASAAPDRGASKSDPKIWENYDFVPGNRVLFYTDFSDDGVGNFPRGLKYRTGAAEVVDRGGIKVLRSTARSEFLVPVPKGLPQRFTLEFDVIPVDPGLRMVVGFEGGPQPDRGDKSAEVTWDVAGTAIVGSGLNIATSGVRFPEDLSKRLIGAPTHLRVLMDGPYFKMYMNERRLFNVPELQFKRDTVIRVYLAGTEQTPIFLTSLRVAESETPVLYDALASKGRWATQGILFATGKSEIQPESRPVLKEIASTLTQHADLKILIEGHTDNVGAAASNLALSAARAAAVKTALVSGYGIAAARITTKGLGDTKPAAANTTAEGRAQNRRVEVVKQ